MLKNYLQTAFRNLWNNKFYSSINIAGLAVGLAVGIMILLWVQDELSYDKFHKNAPRIYTVISNLGSDRGKMSFNYVPAPIAPYSIREVPEVADAVRVTPNYDFNLIEYGDKQFTESRTAYTEASFFRVFDFKLKAGNKARPFPDGHSVVLTATTAKKYFGNDDPIGKIIQADGRMNFTVTGVMEDFPDNSSLKYDILFSFQVLIDSFDSNDYWKALEEDWGNYNHMTFLLVNPNAKLENIGKKLTELQRSHNKFDKSSYYTVQPLADAHLIGPDGNESALQTVRIFLIVSIFILLIASINYINLSTARALVRSKEVSVRKIIGAGRLQLFLQFILETAILFIISSLLAVIMIKLLMPLYNQLSGKNLDFSFLSPHVWTIIGITILSALVLSSIYPALLLSSFKPIQALKGKITLGIGNASFRKILVTTQFIFSVGLIIGTLIISKQLGYIREKELGYDKENVFSFGMRDMQPHYEAIKAELLKQPGVRGITSTSQDIVNVQSNTGDTDWEGKDPNKMFLITPIGIDKDYLQFFKLNLVAGKGFEGTKADSAYIILNETAVREAGIKDPIGKRFTLWQTACTIIGVAKDFHFSSLKEKIKPAALYYAPAHYRMLVKTTGKDAPQAIAAAEKMWKRYNPAFPFEYNFLDETYDQLYKSDQRTAVLFRMFAIIAILISCLGLLGLATYTAQVKIKEIGIRKVLGATATNIVGMLSKEFIKLVLIALVIAAPVAWYFMNSWLQDFAYRISIGWTVFLTAGLIAVFIAFATIAFQAVKAALANPVKSLRTE